jgi:glutathione S-transferase
MIWHLALPDDWIAATRSGGPYTVSTRGMSLGEVGFIHCSHPHQIDGVAQRFYGDCETLLLLQVDPARVGSPVIEEPPADGIDELFPHIYGPLPIDAVTRIGVWRRSADGWNLDQAGPENTPEWSGDTLE